MPSGSCVNSTRVKHLLKVIHEKPTLQDPKEISGGSFHIDPFGGRRLHSGMCQSAVKHEVPIPHELEVEKIPDVQTILSDFAVTHVTQL